MLEWIQLIGVLAALVSALFWAIGAGIRIPPIRFWRIGSADPTTTALQRQSLMNAFAAIFAAIATMCQAIIIYVTPE